MLIGRTKKLSFHLFLYEFRRLINQVNKINYSIQDNISGENKLGVDRLRKIVKYIIKNFLYRLINMPKIFEYSYTLYR